MGYVHITAKDVGSCMGGETYFGSDPKEFYKSYLQSPLESHNEEEDKATPLGCEPYNLVEEKATIVPLHKGEEYEIPRYDVLPDMYKDHILLQIYEIAFSSYHGSSFVEDSKADRYVGNEVCVVDPCKKKDGNICQQLEGENLMDDILCEAHQLRISLKEDKEKIMASMNNLVHINALVIRCHWKDSLGELEG